MSINRRLSVLSIRNNFMTIQIITFFTAFALPCLTLLIGYFCHRVLDADIGALDRHCHRKYADADADEAQTEIRGHRPCTQNQNQVKTGFCSVRVIPDSKVKVEQSIRSEYVDTHTHTRSQELPISTSPRHHFINLLEPLLFVSRTFLPCAWPVLKIFEQGAFPSPRSQPPAVELIARILRGN